MQWCVICNLLPLNDGNIYIELVREWGQTVRINVRSHDTKRGQKLLVADVRKIHGAQENTILLIKFTRYDMSI